MSAKDFRLQIDQWFKDEVEERIVLATRLIGLEALKRVIEKSPVDTGRFRGNWQVAIGSPATGVLNRADKSGAQALSAGSAVIDGLTETQAIWLVNNLPYATFLENGSSKQAPTGMVAVTLAELEAHFGRVE